MYDTATNPIPYNGLFATPESPEAFAEYLQSMSAKERATAFLVAQMAFNLAHKLVEDEILSKEIFGG
jgi:hypothetical protein